MKHPEPRSTIPLRQCASAGQPSRSRAPAEFVDHRREALVQRILITALAQSRRSQLQGAATTAVHASPRALVQRQQIAALFGPPVQRTAATDNIAEGDRILTATDGYQANVWGQVDAYTNKIRQLDDTGDAYYEDFAVGMSSGYKTWSENYYNKTQAYLYEAQKAATHTRVDGQHNQNRFAVLGEDTDLQPDLSVGVQHFEIPEGGVPQATETTLEAVEFKASTSASYDSLDKLVAGGFQQLKKREDTDRFQKLRLEVHNDNANNHWPITDHRFENDFQSDLNSIGPADYSARLQTRTDALVATHGITLPISVTAEHGGAPYGVAEANAQ